MAVKMSVIPGFNLSSEDITDFEKVKGKIFTVLRNKNFLPENLPENAVKVEFLEDYFLTFRILMGEVAENEGWVSVPITEENLKTWGKNKEEFCKEALLLSAQNFPAESSSLMATCEEITPGSFSPEKISADPQIILSSSLHLFGAGVIAYPGLLEAIATHISPVESFFVFPSSVHEVILMPLRADMQTAFMAVRPVPDIINNFTHMIKDVNDFEVNENDILGYNLMFFSKETGLIKASCVTDTIAKKLKEIYPSGSSAVYSAMCGC